MSQENVEIVRRMYDAYYGGDADGALAFFSPDVVSDHSRRLGGGISHGREGLRAQITEWVGTFEDYREEIEEIRDLGSLVCVVAIQRGQGKGSGVDVERRYALLYEIQGDEITRFTVYSTLPEALEAAGLRD
jgi:ketosteroid isomerase-like protein